LKKKNNLKEQFINFIINNNLFSKEDTIIVAVSGGIDSCILLNLFYNLKYKCVVAHCNFSLRNEESDNDEKFVIKLATKYKYEIIVKKFETTKYAEENGLSIQMAARELRYTFFEEIRQKYNCKVIATAHHADDNIETFFINLIRGTGLKGISGIPVKNGRIVRPLLFATRDEIYTYAKLNNIEWCEDSSNKSLKYMRNKIRHNLMPLLEEIKPDSQKTILRNIEHFRNTEILLKEILKDKIEKIIRHKNDTIYIALKELTLSNSGKTILYEIINPYGFNPKQINKIWETINSLSGKMFYSKNYYLNKDREQIIISPINKENNKFKYYIDIEQDWISEPFEMSIEKMTWDANQKILKDKNIAMFDADNIEFPLVIRRWNFGDYFQPYGMKGFKKLSDYFIDEKISVIEKEKIWIIESSNKIVWIIGQRIDDRFKITNNTKNILVLQLY